MLTTGTRELLSPNPIAKAIEVPVDARACPRHRGHSVFVKEPPFPGLRRDGGGRKAAICTWAMGYGSPRDAETQTK